MTFIASNHITNYWLSENIIDCGEIINEEKLNNNYNYEILEVINESTIRSSEFDRGCYAEENSQYYNKQTNRNENSNNRKFNKKETNEHFNLFKNINSNNDERKMYILSKNSRLYEYKTKGRKVLLDTFYENRII
jgi:hypothetical protein